MYRFHLPYLVVIHVLFGVSFGMNLWRGERSEAGRNVNTDWENADTLLGNVDEEAFKELEEILTPQSGLPLNHSPAPLEDPEDFKPCEKISLTGTDQEVFEDLMNKIKPHLWSHAHEAIHPRLRRNFGHLPAYETEVHVDGEEGREKHRFIGFQIPRHNAAMTAYDQRVEKAYERLIKWVVFYNAALLHSEKKSGPLSLTMSFTRWIKIQFFESRSSQPITGKRKNPDQLTYSPDEFGELQQMTLNCLAKSLEPKYDPLFQQTACNLVGIYYTKVDPTIIKFRSEEDFWKRIRIASVVYAHKINHGN